MRVIFIKPSEKRTCVIDVYLQEGRMYVKDVAMCATIEGAFERVKSWDMQDVEMIKYDGTVYMQAGREFRDETELPIYIYKLRGRTEDKIEGQTPWMQDNLVFLKSNTSTEYLQFKALFKDYTKGDKENIAVNTLVDASKYMRRLF